MLKVRWYWYCKRWYCEQWYIGAKDLPTKNNIIFVFWKLICFNLEIGYHWLLIVVSMVFPFMLAFYFERGQLALHTSTIPYVLTFFLPGALHLLWMQVVHQRAALVLISSHSLFSRFWWALLYSGPDVIWVVHCVLRYSRGLVAGISILLFCCT